MLPSVSEDILRGVAVANVPEELAAQVTALTKKYGRDLVQASLPTKKRGRPAGSGINDRAALYRMGKLLYADPDLAVSRAAFQSLHLTEVHSPGSAARRLRGKFQRQRRNWIGAVDALVNLDQLVEELRDSLQALEVSNPLTAQDKLNLRVQLAIRDTIQTRAKETEETGPEEAEMDIWLLAHALDDKWADFFSKRPFVRGKIPTNKPP